MEMAPNRQVLAEGPDARGWVQRCLENQQDLSLRIGRLDSLDNFLKGSAQPLEIL
jgi:hypothetical protein